MPSVLAKKVRGKVAATEREQDQNRVTEPEDFGANPGISQDAPVALEQAGDLSAASTIEHAQLDVPGDVLAEPVLLGAYAQFRSLDADAGEVLQDLTGSLQHCEPPMYDRK